MAIQILHNPRCSKSRQTLAILNERGIELEITHYLEDTPTVDELREIINKLGVTPYKLIRKGEAIFKQNFKGKDLNDDEWIQVMVDNPKLIERPIVINGNKAEIGRPPEKVMNLL